MFFPTLLPAIEYRPRECQSGTPSEMPIPAGKVTDLKAAVYEQVELGLVLKVEGAQGGCRIQAVQPVLFGEEARFPVIT